MPDHAFAEHLPPAGAPTSACCRATSGFVRRLRRRFRDVRPLLLGSSRRARRISCVRRGGRSVCRHRVRHRRTGSGRLASSVRSIRSRARCRCGWLIYRRSSCVPCPDATRGFQCRLMRRHGSNSIRKTCRARRLWAATASSPTRPIPGIPGVRPAPGTPPARGRGLRAPYRYPSRRRETRHRPPARNPRVRHPNHAERPALLKASAVRRKPARNPASPPR